MRISDWSSDVCSSDLNAEALERMEKVDTLVVDKTGTLTEGKPSVVAIEVADGFEEQDLLRIAASLERSSEHPLAAAIVKAAEDRGLALVEPSGVGQPVGKGIVGAIVDQAIVLGNANLDRKSTRLNSSNSCPSRLP